jgi:uncharacterized protein
MNRDEAEKQALILTEAGSKVLGLNIEGSDDRDLLGVCIEPFKEAWTLGSEFEQFIHRDAAVREGRHDAPSQPGDIDLTLFSLKKFCRLAAAGNPSVLFLFFVPKAFIIRCDSRGYTLQDMAPLFISKEAGYRYLGYMQGQKERLLGTRGQMRVNRRELVDKHGYDTKYAYHILRLGYQGCELMDTGRLTLPMRENQRNILMRVRKGEYSLDWVIAAANNIENALKKSIDCSPVQAHPDREAIAEWMRTAYFEWWKAQDLHIGIERARQLREKLSRRGIEV